MVAIALLMCALVVASQQADSVAGNDGIVFTIEHRLDGENFVPRTKINLVKKADGKQALVFPEKNGIFGDDTAPLRKLLQENSLYTIRIQSHSGNTSSAPILASLPAVSPSGRYSGRATMTISLPSLFQQCELQKSGFKEDMTVYFDGKQKLIGVAYSTPASTVARECDHTKVLYHFLVFVVALGCTVTSFHFDAGEGCSDFSDEDQAG